MPSSKHERLELAGLPADVLHVILDQLEQPGRPWLLYPVLLASRKFYELAIPHLYRRVSWSINTRDEQMGLDPKLLHMLDRENQGLSYIRYLTLSDASETSRSPENHYEYPEIDMLVYFLPKDILHGFQWWSQHSLPARVYQTLLLRQKSLTEVELNWAEKPIDDWLVHAGTPLTDQFDAIHRLRLMPGYDEPISQVACRLLQQHHEIRTLTLDLWHVAQDDEDYEKTGRSANGNMARQLFANIGPSGRCLRILELGGVDFRGSHSGLVAAVNFTVLEELAIIKCRHPETFLAALTEANGRSSLRLKVFEIYHSRQWQPPNTATGAPGTTESNSLVWELGSFLKKVPGTLRDLWICLRGFRELPDVASIARHGNTLQWLFLDIRVEKGSWAVTYPLTDWTTICRSLTNLRQLDTTYPSVVADGNTGEYPDFWEYVRATVDIPMIKILGINNWPWPIGSDPEQRSRIAEISNEAYSQLLATLATEIVNLHGSPERHHSTAASWDNRGSFCIAPTKWEGATVVTFGVYDEEIRHRQNPGWQLEPIVFVKSYATPWEGERKIMMMAVQFGVFLTRSPYAEEWGRRPIDAATHDVGKFEAGDEEW
ncbi:MAG: hypothetical protein Q9208_007490 [Pyrenodesmia sp. 3 TL-2023]